MSKHEKSKGKRSGDHDCSFELKKAKVSLLAAVKHEGQWIDRGTNFLGVGRVNMTSSRNDTFQNMSQFDTE